MNLDRCAAWCALTLCALMCWAAVSLAGSADAFRCVVPLLLAGAFLWMASYCFDQADHGDEW